ncbi:MAG: MarR family transcriptional regulator [Gemmatimonadales bacterium]|nr:MarR family transcriptional regulator [Gemmatimonadales bacterium]
MSELDPKELLDRLATLSRAERRAAGAESGLNAAQLDALAYLDRANKYSDTPAGLADFLASSRGTASQTLLALERKGLINKTPDANDGRVAHCSLTPAGRKALTRAAAGDPIAHELAQLGAPERTQLVALLQPVLRAAQQSRGGLTFGVCRTCTHFQRQGPRRFQCGLTGETLTQADSERICREHALS